MTGSFMRGQDPLSELRDCENAESVDALFFISRSGAVTLLAAAHRASSPYDTVQATFDDDGTDLPYVDLDMDFSESFLANEWNVTAKGGLLQTASDATSIARYFKRPQSLTDIPVNSDAQASTIATAMLAKHKDPLTRILGIDLDTSEPAVTEAVFRRDLGDRVRIFRTSPGGGARVDQTSFIQKITMDAKPHADGSFFARVKFGVSPL